MLQLINSTFELIDGTGKLYKVSFAARKGKHGIIYNTSIYADEKMVNYHPRFHGAADANSAKNIVEQTLKNLQ